MYDFIFLKIAAFLAAVLFIFILLKRKSIVKKKTSFNMFGYNIIYSDTKPKNKKYDVEYGTLLKSDKLDIQGKPDLIFESCFLKRIVPVEIKSGKIKNEAFPHYGDLMQLAAYFVIIEEEYSKKIKYGKLIYNDYMFIVYNTHKLRNELLCVIKDMRSMLNGIEFKTESDFIKCRHCICKMTVCKYYKE